MAEITERTILAVMADIAVTFRAGRVDDSPASETERTAYPYMEVRAGGGTQQGDRSMFYMVQVEVWLVTKYTGDPKRTVLASLEDQFRQLMDGGGITDQFNAIAEAAGSRSRLQGVIDITGSPVGIAENKDQSIVTTMTFKVCGRGDVEA